MIVVGLDPGTTQSALVGFDGERVIGHIVESNNHVLGLVGSPYELFGRWGRNSDSGEKPVLIIEAVESFGMAVGKEVFETVFWSGRFAEAWNPARWDRLPRRLVKQHLCHTARATDANIRQVLIDRFGPVGTKKEPGILYGIKSHCWAALAVAVTYWDQHQAEAESIRPGVQPEF